jgi:eukaryotic-like serine/threonine-protein kinase
VVIGSTISHYEVLEKIGQGGMGVVYKSRDTILGRLVALKVLAPDAVGTPDRRHRLIKEARTVSKLNHPNIVTIYEVAEADGVDFIAMEYVDGSPLNTVLHGGPLSVERAVRYGAEVAGALAAAHQAGIVHRDIKPGNILITRDDRAKVLDFGLAKVIESSPGSQPEAETRTEVATQPGTVVGTVAYMSPEQAEGKAMDQRSDIFSLGVVLFEMLSGRRPFGGDSQLSTLLSILKDPAPDLTAIRSTIPAPLSRIVRRCLEKKPSERYQSAAELARDLGAAPRSAVSRYRWLAATLALLVIAVAMGWWIHRESRIRWAKNTVLVEARRLVDQAKMAAAYDLAEQAEKIVPNDPDLKKLWQDVARNVKLESSPNGAKVWRKDLTEPDSAFRFMGVTPLQNFRTVRGYHHLKFEKEGYATSNEIAMANAVEMRYFLAPKLDVPEGMVLIPPAPQLTQSLAGLPTLNLTGLDAFFIDRYEVSNRKFKAFVDAGGYAKPEYWTEPFTEGAKTLSFEQAMERFRDSTGRPGPASWIGGSFPEGQDDFPVSGVSWYEAAAYAKFAGKNLPTLSHWFRVADPRISVIVGPLSNIGGKQIAKVGQFPNSAPFGASDMFGNVKEWVYNEAGDGLRFIEGGAANELAYQVNAVDARPPWDRALYNGFRCVRYPKPPDAAYLKPYIRRVRDFSAEKPASDEAFAALKRFYTCESGDLKAAVDAVDDSNEDWRKEKVSFQSCYGEERVFGHLFLPKAARPPFQCILYSPGADAQTTPSSENLSGFGRVDFIIRSGRAVFWPVIKGEYERRFTQPAGSATEARNRRIQAILDLSRSVDYLQARTDILKDGIGYAGTSFGSTSLGVIVVALEPRLRTAVLMDGGLSIGVAAGPEVDGFNFAPRIKAPVLMVNGRYDFTYPVASSQEPLFRLLGSPEHDKRHVLFDAAHDTLLDRTGLIREVLKWLDRYLGTVKK